MSTHVYQALEGPKHIRLIALHPASSKDAPLRINFLSSDLGELEARYEAISYTWGQPNLTFALHVDDGSQVFVTENLDRALRYLRRAECDRLLWADAVSINQTDHEEKAVQIPLMVQIFRGARKVLAWLDPGGDTTVEQKGMRELDRLSRASRIQVWDGNKSLNEVLRFLSLPWFNRLWIVQEVVFNLDIYLICGGMELIFSRLVVALSVLQRHIRVNELSESRMTALKGIKMAALEDIGKLWNRHSLTGIQSHRALSSETEAAAQILNLVERFSSYGCTDPRDRIFALYSMATDVRHSSQVVGSTSPLDEPVSINIDYSLDVCGTYQAFALSCWERPRTHREMWEALFSRQHSPQPTNLASWAPDWRVEPQDWRRITSNFSPFYPKFNQFPEIGWHTTGRAPAAKLLRVWTKHVGTAQDTGLENICTIQLKTSRTLADDQTPFLTQLSQLHRLLQNTKSSRNESGISNILIDTISAFFPLVSDEDLMVLEQHLASMEFCSEQADSACNTIVPSFRVQEIVNQLNRESPNNELFCFQHPRTKLYYVGIGNKNMETGDRVAFLDGGNSRSPDGKGFLVVLILRKVGQLDDTQLPVFRFIGSGYLLDYTYMFTLKSVRRHYSQDKKTRAQEAAREEYGMNPLLNNYCRWLKLV